MSPDHTFHCHFERSSAFKISKQWYRVPLVATSLRSEQGQERLNFNDAGLHKNMERQHD